MKYYSWYFLKFHYFVFHNTPSPLAFGLKNQRGSFFVFFSLPAREVLLAWWTTKASCLLFPRGIYSSSNGSSRVSCLLCPREEFCLSGGSTRISCFVPPWRQSCPPDESTRLSCCVFPNRGEVPVYPVRRKLPGLSYPRGPLSDALLVETLHGYDSTCNEIKFMVASCSAVYARQSNRSTWFCFFFFVVARPPFFCCEAATCNNVLGLSTVLSGLDRGPFFSP